tara:strand:+ start:175 stop:366 length:192 start_codon:yes stop_codon:yes gene_type:complete
MAWLDIKRNPFRARRKAVSASKRRFYTLDLPQLLRECEILTEDNKYGYCQIKQRYTYIEEVIQ